MELRRCSKLFFEPREVACFELGNLLSGGTGVVSRIQWYAHALSTVVEVDSEDIELLGD